MRHSSTPADGVNASTRAGNEPKGEILIDEENNYSVVRLVDGRIAQCQCSDKRKRRYSCYKGCEDREDTFRYSGKPPLVLAKPPSQPINRAMAQFSFVASFSQFALFTSFWVLIHAN